MPGIERHGTASHDLSVQVQDQGMNLTASQRQLICLARCLLAQPTVLLLDEATSALDSATEMRVQEVLLKTMAGSTVVSALRYSSWI